MNYGQNRDRGRLKSSRLKKFVVPMEIRKSKKKNTIDVVIDKKLNY